jgi:hypothetical protein
VICNDCEQEEAGLHTRPGKATFISQRYKGAARKLLKEDKMSIWSNSEPLFVYGNEDKLDDLISRIYGVVLDSLEVSSTKGKTGSAKAGVEFGGFLSAVGKATGEVEGGVSSENMKSRLGSVTFDTKMRALIDYAKENEPYPFIDLVRGVRLVREAGKSFEEWKTTPISEQDQNDYIGNLVGLFKARRIEPPHDEKTSIVGEFLNQSASLWSFATTDECKVKATMPVVMKHTRTVSQLALMAFANMAELHFQILATGLLTWNKGQIFCDPIAWRLLIFRE